VKYKNKKVIVDGITFDSTKESKRYHELKLLERAGVITQLELQPRLDLVVNGQKICFYRGDFGYYENGIKKIEDVKSAFTAKMPVYRLKKKLVKAIHGIDIIEV
jgi:hypothetical protein